MGIATTNAIVVRNMIAVGLGLGVTMPVFVIVVQNALPYDQLGVVTSSIQFFRSIGGTIGVAVMGSFLNNRLAAELQGQMPPQLKQVLPPEQLSQLNNTQLLVNAEALARMREQFTQFGPQGEVFLQQMLLALKNALSLSLQDVFLVGVAVAIISLAVTFFLKEIPLRKKHGPAPEEGSAEPSGEALVEGIASEGGS
jgi:uncharacterized membrane protein